MQVGQLGGHAVHDRTRPGRAGGRGQAARQLAQRGLHLAKLRGRRIRCAQLGARLRPARSTASAEAAQASV